MPYHRFACDAGLANAHCNRQIEIAACKISLAHADDILMLGIIHPELGHPDY